jgi:predicted tellurium resistance membrane protein TerC
MVWGSTLFIRWMERFPWIIYIGSGVLAVTAGKMLVGDPLVVSWFSVNPVMKWTLIVIITASVLLAGIWRKKSGSFVTLTSGGNLALSQELTQEANIQPDDSFKVSQDEQGRIVLVKQTG